MTVNYTSDVASSRFGGFLHLLIRWKGSVYKLLWKDFIVYCLAYFTISLTYRFAMKESQKRNFEIVCLYCAKYGDLIPIAFLLGFYLEYIMDRWWRLFLSVPWPDRSAILVNSNIQGDDDTSRLMRRTVIRYCNLSFAIVMSSISPPVAKRFPSFQHLTDAGLMLPSEQKVLEETETPYNKYFIPISWANKVIAACRTMRFIKNDHAMQALIDEMMEFRTLLGDLLLYDWICAPLTYTQVVTIAVYSFFISQIFGAQFLIAPPESSAGKVPENDVYVPVFLFLQFIFYQGWLKVAESHLHPFGDDDDDFDVNTVIDRNIQICYLMVDTTKADIPKPDKDRFWDEKNPDIPYFNLVNIKPDQAFFDMGSAALHLHAASVHDAISIHDDSSSIKNAPTGSSTTVNKVKKVFKQRSTGLKTSSKHMGLSFTSVFDPIEEEDGLSQTSRIGIFSPKKQTASPPLKLLSRLTIIDENEVVKMVAEVEAENPVMSDKITVTDPDGAINVESDQSRQVTQPSREEHVVNPVTPHILIPQLQTTAPSTERVTSDIMDKPLTLGDFVLAFEQDHAETDGDGAGTVKVQFIPAATDAPLATVDNITVNTQNVTESDILVISQPSKTISGASSGVQL